MDADVKVCAPRPARWLTMVCNGANGGPNSQFGRRRRVRQCDCKNRYERLLIVSGGVWQNEAKLRSSFKGCLGAVNDGRESLSPWIGAGARVAAGGRPRQDAPPRRR